MHPIGTLGTVFLVLANILLVTRYARYFPPVALIGSFLLLVHAVRIDDTSFIIVNGFITLLLAIKTWRGFDARPPYLPLAALLRHVEAPNREPAYRFLHDLETRFAAVPGSSHNHQAWPGGLRDHVTEACNLANLLYPALAAVRPLPFTLGDAILAVLLHDAEKAWKYALGKDELQDADLSTKEKRHAFRMAKIAEYGFRLTPEQLNGIEFAEGELHQYSNRKRHMLPLAAFVHCCDVLSARAFHDHPLPLRADPWRGAHRHAERGGTKAS